MDISELVHLDQMNDHSSVKKYPCNWPGCQKSFGTKFSLFFFIVVRCINQKNTKKL